MMVMVHINEHFGARRDEEQVRGSTRRQIVLTKTKAAANTAMTEPIGKCLETPGWMRCWQEAKSNSLHQAPAAPAARRTFTSLIKLELQTTRGMFYVQNHLADVNIIQSRGLFWSEN